MATGQSRRNGTGRHQGGAGAAPHAGDWVAEPLERRVLLAAAAGAGLASVRAGELFEAVAAPGPGLPPVQTRYDMAQQAALRGPTPPGGTMMPLEGVSLTQGGVGAAGFFDPDFTPVQPSGWSGPIVTSRVTGTNTHATSISTADNVFVDLAVGNIGLNPSPASTLLINLDGAFWNTLSIPAMPSGGIAAAVDLNFGRLGAGGHVIEVLADPSNFVVEFDEFNNYASRTFTVTGAAQPDLAAFQPPGWSGSIVASKVANTTTDAASFLPTDPVFVDFALSNVGTLSAGAFSVQLLVDNVVVNTFGSPGLEPFSVQGAFNAVQDFQLPALAAGPHTISVKLDSGSAVTESNEGNNTFSKPITIGPAAGPDLAGFHPSQWSGAIVVSKVAGTSVDAAGLLASDPLFIDLAFNNVGTQSAGAFQLQLLVDNVVVATFGSPGLEPFSVQGQFQLVQDRQLAPLANGQHTIGVRLDSGNAVAESNESNNLYSKQITVGPATPGSIAGTVFNDADGDGARDAGEGALSGWQVYVDADNDGVLDPGEAPVNSNAQGAYTLGNLQPGTYNVRQVVQAGFEQTAPAGTASDFNVEVVFPDGSLTASQRAAFTTAADRWMQVITGDLPDILFEGELIDDVRITATGPAIDGPGMILGQAGPRALRGGTLLPLTGIMEFDSADLAEMESSGRLLPVILHEMGHVLGIGTLWAAELKNFISGSGTDDPRYTAPRAVAEFNTVFGTAGATLPIENTGGPGSREGHWRDSVLRTELMTSFAEPPGVPMPLSRITIGGMDDLGYQVNYDAADPYVAPAAGSAGAAAGVDPFDGGYFTRPGVQVVNAAAAAGHVVGPAAGPARAHVVVVAAGQNVTGKDFGNRATQPANQPPTVGGLADGPDPVTLGGTITLTATGVADPDGNNTLAAVTFYRESNGTAGLQVGGDAQVGNDTNGTDGWTAVVGTAGLAAGTTYTYYARATDNAGAASAAASTTNTVQPAATLPNLAPFQKAGWSDELVLSTVPGTNTDAASISTPDTLYVDWAYNNFGPGNAVGRIFTRLLLDGAQVGEWFTDNLAANFHTFVEDFARTGLAAGPHTITLEVDHTNVIAEGNEADNSYSRPFTVVTPNQPPAIASVTASPNPAPPDTFTVITANGVTDPDGNNTVADVRFYQESNGSPGLQTGAVGDALFHTDPDGGDGWSVDLDLFGVPAGTYPVYALATDNRGATSPTGAAAATVDLVVAPPPNQRPTVASLTANPTSVNPGQNVALTANGVADPDGGVAGVSFYRESNGAAGLQTGGGGDTLIGTDNNPFAGWTATLATAGLAAGPYVLYARATDNQGATSDPPAQTTVTVTGPSQSPGAPDLADASDTGASSSDNLTKLDNSAGAAALTFSVGGTVAGALVEVLAGAQVIGSATAAGTTTVVTTNGAFDLTDGAHSITARQTEPGKQASPPSPALVLTVDTAAPAVSGVLLSGSDWSGDFVNYLRDRGLGDGGFAVPAVPGPADLLPWTNLNRVTLRFTEPPAGPLLISHLRVAGVNQFTHAVGGFNAAGLTWSLSSVIARDRLLISLTPGVVADAAGNAMPAFSRRVDVLPGDVNRSGTTNIADQTQVRNRSNVTPANPGTAPNLYTAFHDVNGSAVVNIADQTLIRNRSNDTLPAGTPAASLFGARRIAAARGEPDELAAALA